MTTFQHEQHTPSSRYSGERAGERGERREASEHRSIGKTAPDRNAIAAVTPCAPGPSPLPSPRSTGKREKVACASRSGFTLLELIIAMGMASMLALALYTAMRVTIKAREAAAAAVDPVRSATIAMDMIQADFESVPSPPPSDASTNVLGGPFYGTHQAAGQGDSDTIEFCTIGADPIEGDPTTAPPLSEGVRRVELYVTGGDARSSALVRRVTRNLLPASEAPYEEEILCLNVRSFSLRYYDGTTWQEEWDSTLFDDSLPASVAITLELGEANSDKPGQRITRVVPLACAKNSMISGETTSTGGVQ